MGCVLNRLVVLFATSVSYAQINYTGFESFADESAFVRSSWTSEGFTVPWVDGFDQNRAYVDDAYAHSGTKSLRVTFPVDQFGPQNSGAQAPLKVTGQNQYYISYWLRFSDNFSWGNTNQGGKLPGLAGGSNCSGCETCMGTNGFSARLMWRTGGKAVLYLYHMDKAGSCGDNINLQVSPGVDFVFQKGQWYNIIERVKVNTGNNFDGEVQLWLNEQPALTVTGIRFVNNGDMVDNLYFSTFHGGSTSGWSPTETCYIWFDDMKIAINSSDVFTTLGIQDETSISIPFINNAVQTGDLLVNDSLAEGTLMWYDIIGRLMCLQGKDEEKKVPVLSPGFYFVVLQTRNNVRKQKVMVR